MRLLWTLLKVALVLALAIPATIFVLATALGLFGALMGLAFMVLRIAIIGLIGYGVLKLAVRLFRGPAPRPVEPVVRELPKVDPYYEAAMREVNQAMGERSR